MRRLECGDVLPIRVRLAGLMKVGKAVGDGEGMPWPLRLGILVLLRRVPPEGDAVGEAELRRAVRDRLGLRIGAEMSRYLLGKLGESDRGVAVFGADARTGVVRREMVDVHLLGKEQP